MTRMFLTAALIAALNVPAAHAANTTPAAAAEAPAKKISPQQQKMRDCNHQAKEQNLKGDARKTFMSGCLKKD